VVPDALREIPPPARYGAGDVLVLFGELFGRGYANGIVEQARRAGMTVIGATVGRREQDGLRPLGATELAEAEALLGGTILNIPLEAGFDLEPAGDGPSPADQLKGVRPDDWESSRLDWELVARSREAGARRFERSVTAFVEELSRRVPAEANVLFVHTMAGGFPRARVYLPLLNRVFRSAGDRFLPSEAFWRSDLGRLWALSFDEVTGKTFEQLVAATAPLRVGARRVRYVAFGYHGCEVRVAGKPRWQSYVPYLQGWAKLLLERCARAAWDGGVRGTVFNAPEIWTNSSSLFLGVEVSLYPLLLALRDAAGGPGIAAEIEARCRGLLKPGASLDGLLARADRYLDSPVLVPFRDPDRWPQHSSREQLEEMLAASAETLAMSADHRHPVCAELSRPVVEAVGKLMFDESWEPSAPVRWLGHDVVVRRLTTPE
jgi:hypothetical protein